jgi:monoamine oxidase
MPRTPLLSRVGALARAARLSQLTGAPADEVLDPAWPGAPAAPGAVTQATLSRRALLGYAAAGAGLAACGGAERLLVAPGAPAAARTPAPGARVAVVGAGLAGLTCAYRLRQQGVDAVVFEANATRLGGRCWTDRETFAGGQIAEHGGELIDQGHTAIRQLARELGLALDNVLRAEPPGTGPFFWLNGGRYDERDAVRDLKAAWQPLHRDYADAGFPTLYTASTPRGRELDATSIGQWIDRTVPGGRASLLGRLLAVAYTIEYGAEPDEQSALNLVYLLGASGQGQLRLFGPSNEKYKVRGGNDQLVTRMAAALGGRVEAGRVLEAVRRAGSRWTLAFQGGPERTFDRVVLALPFSLLRKVDTAGAGFPEAKRRAIAELRMGRNAKLNMQFTSRRWQALGNGGDTFADTGYQATWEATRAQAGAAGILVNYTGGAATDAQRLRADADRPLDFLARAEPVLPGLGARWNGKYRYEDWPGQPWALGSYSYYRPGQYARFAGAEGEAVGGCHFAGEHTSIDAQGYLEGAVESGERAAREVLAALGVIPRA